MKFGLILAGVTILTLILIFGFYKLFLDKPAPAGLRPTPKPVSQESQIAENGSLPVNTAAAPAPSKTPSPSKTSAPSATPFKSTIGTLTVLQNNLSGETSTSTSTGSSTISGTISFNGTAPTGTSLVIVARPNGTTQAFKTVVSGIAASSNTKWSWATANQGTAYDMIAILKGSSGGVDTDYAASQTYIITAPSINQVFSVNAAPPPSAPTGTITTTCTTHSANNTWAATINFPTVSGAEWYILQVGTTSEGTDIVNSTLGVQSGDKQTVSATLTDSVLYHAQYAVASAPYPRPYQYSEFSAPTTIKCP